MDRLVSDLGLFENPLVEYCFSMTYEHLKLPNFEKTLHEPFMAASISGHLSLQCPWVPKILFALPESILVKIEPLYALVFRMQAVWTLTLDALAVPTSY